MIIKAIAVDDEVLALHKIERFCKQVEYIDLVEKFNNPVDAEAFLMYNRIDLVFLDVQMNEFTGLELLKRLKVKPHIILTTAFSHYTLKAFELDVDDYLLKPIRFERFKKAVDKVFMRFELENSVSLTPAADEENSEFIFVKSGRKLLKVRLNDILYIEGMRDYLLIVTYRKKIDVLMVFDRMLEILPPGRFLRVHRSYIVSMSKIESVSLNAVVVGSRQIPLSKTYRNSFRERFSSFAR